MRRIVCLVVVGLGVVGSVRVADACGCFAPPSVATPIVQAGERILFARKDGMVTAHVQIQYAGEAADFGWLLPLPSVPTLELGTDEVFTALIAATQPSFTTRFVYENCGGSGGGSGVGCGGASSADVGGFQDARTGSPGPAVVVSAIGPYEYAVLKADSRDDMLAWLGENHYFVPAGTEDVVGRYIHPGAYFLALKLRNGRSAGDIQPVVVHYQSDVAMIPIVLTSVAAAPDMGIQVWYLGKGRAIPRNYAHTVLNDALIDWLNGARNYNDVVIRATREAPGRHTFVTEFAGPSLPLRNVVAPEGRFGTIAELTAQPSLDAFVAYLKGHGYRTAGHFSVPLVDLLTRYAPMPEAIAALHIAPGDFYEHLAELRAAQPHAFDDWHAPYKPADMAAEIDTLIVQPAQKANALFDELPYLTRLFTTLSPEDMTSDPAFTENPGLAGVSNFHAATVTYFCHGGRPSISTGATLETEEGYLVSYPQGTAAMPNLTSIPASRRIESILEEGQPATMVDNDATIASLLAAMPQADSGGDHGCRLISAGRLGGLLLVLGVLAERVLSGRRRRSRTVD